MTKDEILEVMAAGEHNHIQIEFRRLGLEAKPDWDDMPEDYKAGGRKASSFTLAALRAKGLCVVPVEDLEAMARQKLPIERLKEENDVADWQEGYVQFVLAARAMLAQGKE